MGIFLIFKDEDDDDYSYSYDNGLYFLADGETTKKKWDCDGFYLANDVRAIDSSPTGKAQEIAVPVAVKIADGNQLVVRRNPEKDTIEFNISPLKVLKAGDVNWFIPNVAQAVIDTRLPDAPGVTTPIRTISLFVSRDEFAQIQKFLPSLTNN